MRGVKYPSRYAMGVNRPGPETSGILSAIETKMNALADDPEIHRRRVRVRAAGKVNLLPVQHAALVTRIKKTARRALQKLRDWVGRYD